MVLLDKPFVIDGVRFDRYSYDDWIGELQFRTGPTPTVLEVDETVEGHHRVVDGDGNVFSLMLVYPRMLLAADGHIDVTPRTGGATVRLTPEMLAPFLRATGPPPRERGDERIGRTLRAIKPTRRRLSSAVSAAVLTWKAS
jgi:hypothetical protein